jgi:hypothetical protein
LGVDVPCLVVGPEFNITTVADLDACPDVHVFVQGMRDALGSLASQLGSTTRA